MVERKSSASSPTRARTKTSRLSPWRQRVERARPATSATRSSVRPSQPRSRRTAIVARLRSSSTCVSTFGAALMQHHCCINKTRLLRDLPVRQAEIVLPLRAVAQSLPGAADRQAVVTEGAGEALDESARLSPPTPTRRQGPPADRARDFRAPSRLSRRGRTPPPRRDGALRDMARRMPRSESMPACRATPRSLASSSARRGSSANRRTAGRWRLRVIGRA